MKRSPRRVLLALVLSAGLAPAGCGEGDNEAPLPGPDPNAGGAVLPDNTDESPIPGEEAERSRDDRMDDPER